jgi:hypothetical protein
MRTNRVLALLALPAVALLTMATTCVRSGKSWQPPQPVSIAGAGEAMDLFPSWTTWQSSSIDGGTAGLLLRDGDLIFASESMFVYRASDGPTLKVTTNEWSMLLAGKVVSVSLESGTEGREWLEKAPAQDLAAVRFLMLPKNPDAALLPTLKRLAAVNSGVALGVGSNAILQQVLPLFRPRMLMFGADALDADGRKIMAAQQQIETLIVLGEEPGSLDYLRMLPNLHRIVIGGWDIDKTGRLPPDLQGLKSLIIGGPGVKDLSALGGAPAGLEELSLFMCEELVDVNDLARFSGLKTLILTGSEKVLDLSGLAGLKQLQWVGLPPEISQEQFAAFLAAHPNLRILEMVNCENVTDLAPLRDLTNLEGLILGKSYKNLEVLQGLKSLRFVGLAKAIFKGSPDQIAEIRKALPDALVVSVAPFKICLGSGWILLLIPTVVLWRLFQRRQATGPHHA